MNHDRPFTAQPLTVAQYGRCSNMLRNLGKSYPRTCAECGLGPCTTKPLQPVQPTIPEGCVWVPIEPTPEMNKAGLNELSCVGSCGEASPPSLYDMGCSYAAMIAARPQQKE